LQLSRHSFAVMFFEVFTFVTPGVEADNSLHPKKEKSGGTTNSASVVEIFVDDVATGVVDDVVALGVVLGAVALGVVDPVGVVESFEVLPGFVDAVFGVVDAVVVLGVVDAVVVVEVVEVVFGVVGAFVVLGVVDAVVVVEVVEVVFGVVGAFVVLGVVDAVVVVEAVDGCGEVFAATLSIATGAERNQWNNWFGSPVHSAFMKTFSDFLSMSAHVSANFVFNRPFLLKYHCCPFASLHFATRTLPSLLA